MRPNGGLDRLTVGRVRCGICPMGWAGVGWRCFPIRVVRTRNSVMRTSRRIIFALMLGAAPVAGPGFAFDGAPVNPKDAALPVVSQPAAAALNAQALGGGLGAPSLKK